MGLSDRIIATIVKITITTVAHNNRIIFTQNFYQNIIIRVHVSQNLIVVEI